MPTNDDTPTIETWLPAKEYEGLYEVSNLGNVRSCLGGRRMGINLKPGITSGYRNTILVKNSIRKNMLVHRLVANAFIPNPFGLSQVNHINGIKVDNRVENLEWVTPSANSLHAVRSGLSKIRRGSAISTTKLVDEDVRDMRLFAAAGIMHKDIARVYGIKRQTANNIINGKTWSHVS